MVSVLDDLRVTADNNQGAALILLDRSMAFYTVDHEYLLERLEDIGITGVVLQWFRSFLLDRTVCPYGPIFIGLDASHLRGTPGLVPIPDPI
mgnify:CR=1 FL=1